MLAIRTSRLFDGELFVDGDATVLVDGGRVAGLEAGFPDLPEGTDVRLVVNGTVLPGLIDTHVHLVADSEPGALDRVPGYTEDEFLPPRGDVFVMTVDTRVEPARQRGESGWFSVVDEDGTAILTADVSTWIWP